MMEIEASGSQGTSGVRIVTRKYLFDRMQAQNLPNLDEKLNSLQQELLSSEKYSDEQISALKHNFSHFKSQIKKKWLQVHKKEDVFLSKYKYWLEGGFELTVAAIPKRCGRPQKHFSDSGDRSKRRKTSELRSTVKDKDLIMHAASVELIKSGKRDASKVLKDIQNSPTRATKYKKAFSNTGKKEIHSLSPMQALKMMIDADLTSAQYEVIRKTCEKIFPCYTLIQKAKNELYPPTESIRIISTSAECDLQPLVDVTVKRLLTYLEVVLSALKEQERLSLKLICKWGCDGSQQSQFKQKQESDTDCDSNIFQTCFVPLRLVCGKSDKVVWENPTPSSARFCRPLRFRFVKESVDITKEEIDYVTESLKSLSATDLELNSLTFKVSHVFVMTMVDGKVCNAASGTTSTSKCYICGATSKDFNQLHLKHDINHDCLEFGLSVLHARIRLFESILHLAYKLPVRKYRERKTEAEKTLEKERKLEIQRRFRNETGLLVDMPKANFGNTNDGNTSRRFFEDPKLAAEITGINYDLIYRLKVILETISCGHKVDSEKYDKYAFDTAQLYVELYPWHPMTPTMHKILVHGALIIKNALVPIGQLSEEAAEARNKHFRTYRQDFARKFSREDCNRDIFNRLFLSSDPLFSSTRNVKRGKLKSYLPETLSLLIPAQPNESDSSDNENL